MRDDATGWRHDLDEWVQGRSPWGRLVVLLLLVRPAWVPLHEMEWTLFGGINFGAHEFGHLFFALFGNEFLAVLGGSLMQLLVPLGAGLAVRRANDFVGVAVCGMWLASSLGDLSWYVGDARALALDLVSMGGEGDDHDWNYLLRELGWLSHDTAIAAGLRRGGTLLLLASFAFGLWVCWRMWRSGRAPSDPSHRSRT